MKKNERVVASEFSCVDTLKKFYPEQDTNFIEKRIENTEKNAHMYFRSFPPLFYKIISDLKLKKDFHSLLKFNAIMAGDAHMENFGLKYFKGKLRLSVNDYDDLTEGPIFLDLIRLLSSAKIAGLKIDKDNTEELLKVYIKGIRNKDHDLSPSIKKLIKQSKELDSVDPKEISKSKINFIKKRDNSRDLTEQEIADWESLVVDFGTVHDSYSYIKDYGGSAGLNRFEFSIEKEKKIYWVEAKEWSTPSYNIANNMIPPSDEIRYEKIISYDSPEILPKLTDFNGKTYYIRNIDRRQLGIVLDDYSKKEKKEILFDEIYALGDFHRYYLTNEKNYTEELKNLDIDRLVDIVNQVDTKISKDMGEVK